MISKAHIMAVDNSETRMPERGHPYKQGVALPVGFSFCATPHPCFNDSFYLLGMKKLYFTRMAAIKANYNILIISGIMAVLIFYLT